MKDLITGEAVLLPSTGDVPPISNHRERFFVPALDAILGKSFPVLDKGFIRVVDYMGSDAAIVQAARVSYGKGTKTIREDRGLIRYLMRHRHTTPLEMCEIKLHVKVPMDHWRQWIRHRTANVNEYSTRYSVAIDDMAQTAPDKWRLQAKGNKQGSGEYLENKWPSEFGFEKHPTPGAYLSDREREFHEGARELYKERLEFGIAREQARKDLPLSNFTEAYWKIDLHNLFHFLSLRMDTDAQREIRDYAVIIGNEIVSRWVPSAWEAFVDYRLEGQFLSGPEMVLLREIIKSDYDGLNMAEITGWVKEKDGKLLRNRERDEFDVKLKRLGITPPWAPEA